VSSDFSFAGSTAASPAIVSITQQTPTRWTVVTKANSSGTVMLSIPAGSIDDKAGNVQDRASNSTRAPANFAVDPDNGDQGLDGPQIDHSVTYVSPLSPSPTSLTVTEGGKVDSYTVATTKAPASDVTLTPAFTPSGDAALTPSPLVLSSTAATVTGAVSAVDNLIVDGTRAVTLATTVSSADPEFDGLVLPSIAVTVNDNDAPIAGNSTFSVTANARPTDGITEHNATATVRNELNQGVKDAVVSFVLPADVSSGGQAGPRVVTATTDESGVATIPLTSKRPGTYPITATVGEDDKQIGDPENIMFSIVPIDISKSTFETSPGTQPADGVAKHTATLTANDENGNPVTGSGALTTDSEGKAQIAITATSSGVKTVTLYEGDDTTGVLAATRTVEFVSGPPSSAQSVLSVTPGDRIADGVDQHTASVFVKDANGNIVAGAPVSFSVPEGVTASSTTAVTAANGVATITLTSTAASSYAIVGMVDGAEVASSPQHVTFVAGPASAAGSALALSTGERTAPRPTPPPSSHGTHTAIRSRRPSWPSRSPERAGPESS